MSRSHYSEDFGEEFPGQLELYRASVDRAIFGQRGQKFLREMAAAMDAMPEKRLITDTMVDCEGNVCAMGAVMVARGLDAVNLDYNSPRAVGKLLGIARSMAAEIAFENDDDYGYYRVNETPEERWTRMRNWIRKNLSEEKQPA